MITIDKVKTIIKNTDEITITYHLECSIENNKFKILTDEHFETPIFDSVYHLKNLTLIEMIHANIYFNNKQNEIFTIINKFNSNVIYLHIDINRKDKFIIKILKNKLKSHKDILKFQNELVEANTTIDNLKFIKYKMNIATIEDIIPTQKEINLIKSKLKETSIKESNCVDTYTLKEAKKIIYNILSKSFNIDEFTVYNLKQLVPTTNPIEWYKELVHEYINR